MPDDAVARSVARAALACSRRPAASSRVSSRALRPERRSPAFDGRLDAVVNSEDACMVEGALEVLRSPGRPQRPTPRRTTAAGIGRQPAERARVGATYVRFLTMSNQVRPEAESTLADLERQPDLPAVVRLDLLVERGYRDFVAGRNASSMAAYDEALRALDRVVKRSRGSGSWSAGRRSSEASGAPCTTWTTTRAASRTRRRAASSRPRPRTTTRSCSASSMWRTRAGRASSTRPPSLATCVIRSTARAVSFRDGLDLALVGYGMALVEHRVVPRGRGVHSIRGSPSRRSFSTTGTSRTRWRT